MPRASPRVQRSYSALNDELRTVAEEIDSMLGQHEPLPEPADPVPEELQPMLERIERMDEESDRNSAAPPIDEYPPERFPEYMSEVSDGEEAQSWASSESLASMTLPADAAGPGGAAGATELRGSLQELYEALSTPPPDDCPVTYEAACDQLDVFSACQPPAGAAPLQEESPLPAAAPPDPPVAADDIPTPRQRRKRNEAPAAPHSDQLRESPDSAPVEPGPTKRACRMPQETDQENSRL